MLQSGGLEKTSIFLQVPRNFRCAKKLFKKRRRKYKRSKHARKYLRLKKVMRMLGYSKLLTPPQLYQRQFSKKQL